MPLLAHRSIKNVVEAALQARHYRAFLNMGLLSGSFVNMLHRYLTGKGEYPTRMAVKTSLGIIHPQLYSFHDLLTLNEVFFRKDYPAFPQIYSSLI
jgi:hypothetical protein